MYPLAKVISDPVLHSHGLCRNSQVCVVNPPGLRVHMGRRGLTIKFGKMLFHLEQAECSLWPGHRQPQGLGPRLVLSAVLIAGMGRRDHERDRVLRAAAQQSVAI